jgi:hypothetical protein
MATTRERTVVNRSYFNARIWKAALQKVGVPVSRVPDTNKRTGA